MQKLSKIIKASILLIPLIILSLYTITSCTDDKYEVTNPNDPRHPDYAKNHPTTTSITTLIVCPTSAPTNVVASDKTYSNKITITWDMVANATGYIVYRSTSASGTYTTLFETAITANSYDDTTTVAETNYYYKVSATKTECTETATSDFNSGIAGFSTTGMVLITGGTFTMGDTWGDGRTVEKPTHSVTVSSFYMDETEVTTEAFEAYIIDVSPSTEYYLTHESMFCNIRINNSVNNDKPVNCVSWEGANAYCTWRGKRLPTEAEWEYAAGGGSAHWKWSLDETTFTSSKYCYDERSSCAVKSYDANSLGLYDMAGNVREWCKDWYQSDFYSSCGSGCTDPECINNTSGYRVSRGGCYDQPYTMLLRTASRGHTNPLKREVDIGFRCVQN